MPQAESTNWSRKSLDELVSMYWQEVAPALQREGVDPEVRPTYEQLTEAGASGLAYALREHHDLTPKEFLLDVVGLQARNGTDGFEWGIDAERTVEVLDQYVRTRRRRRWSDTTADTARSRLARYVRTYADLHGTSDLLAPLTDSDEQPRERDRALAVFDVLDEELSTDDSKLAYLGTVREFYEWLDDSGRADYSPLLRAEREFDWERSEPDNLALDAEEVATLVDEADDLASRMLVLGLCGWGLRASEVASLHVSQFVFDPQDGDVPFIAFDDRKNGPGTVSMLFGVQEAEERIATLSDRDGWNGHLFPSDAAEAGHITSDTVNSRFKSLADRAGVTVAGRPPTSKMGRRFWYSAYANASTAVLEALEDVAEEQGSSSAEVVRRNYISESRRRDLRRDEMRNRLEAAFSNY